MNRFRVVTLIAVVFVLGTGYLAVAQGQDAPTKLPEGMAGSDAGDPRANLPSGLYDAGEASYGIRHLALLKKPAAFQLGTNDVADPKVKKILAQLGFPENANIPAGIQLVSAQLAFANSDLAFQGNKLFMGNFYGVNIYDIANPGHAKLITSMICPGGQGDVSVYKNLMFMSVEMPNGRLDCGSEGFPAAAGQGAQKDRFRGVRIFDISDIKSPKQVGAVQTCRGSHTHTLVTDPKDKDNVYVYVSGTSFVRPSEELAGCSGGKPEDDPDTALFRIDVIKVPVASPKDAKIVSRPRIFADEKTGVIDALKDAGSHDGDGTPSATDQCHDITAYSEIGLAAGACSGNGILLDIKDPANPKRIDAVNDKNYAYWHSAAFSNDGKKVVFTDEWGGGLGARCRENDPNVWGANALFNLDGGKLEFASYYKMPAAQGNTENCVAHNGSLIPIPGRDIKVQAWYQGGISIMDFTDINKPFEIAYFDRGPIDSNMVIMGGSWSAYWYNGYIYSSEIARGLDIFELKPSKYLSQNEIDAAKSVTVDELNVQDQKRFEFPDKMAVARAYIDQLERAKALNSQQVSGLRRALKMAENPNLNPREAARLTKYVHSMRIDPEMTKSAANLERLNTLAGILKQSSD